MATHYYKDECQCGAELLIETDFTGDKRCQKCGLVANVINGEIQRHEEDWETRHWKRLNPEIVREEK